LGFTFKEADWTLLWEIIQNYSIGIISDEVYEHMVFDDKKHLSVLNMPQLRDRSVKISSFGKTFHCTGWKMGYIAANAEITQSIRMVFQYLAFATNSAMQMGITQFMQLNPNWEIELNLFYQKKRDLFIHELHRYDSLNTMKSPWKTLNCEGSYFQVLHYNSLDIAKLEDIQSDLDMAMWLIRTAGIATIPIGAFITGQPKTGCLRICFAKNDETIIKAAQLLNQVF
jgi:methionine transaminase